MNKILEMPITTQVKHLQQSLRDYRSASRTNLSRGGGAIVKEMEMCLQICENVLVALENARASISILKERPQYSSDEPGLSRRQEDCA